MPIIEGFVPNTKTTDSDGPVPLEGFKPNKYQNPPETAKRGQTLNRLSASIDSYQAGLYGTAPEIADKFGAD